LVIRMSIFVQIYFIMESVNPYTQKVIARYDEIEEGPMMRLIERNYEAFTGWRTYSYQQRGSFFKKMARLLRDKKQELGVIITAEMGKIIGDNE